MGRWRVRASLPGPYERRRSQPRFPACCAGGGARSWEEVAAELPGAGGGAAAAAAAEGCSLSPPPPPLLSPRRREGRPPPAPPCRFSPPTPSTRMWVSGSRGPASPRRNPAGGPPALRAALAPTPAGGRPAVPALRCWARWRPAGQREQRRRARCSGSGRAGPDRAGPGPRPGGDRPGTAPGPLWPCGPRG